MLIDVSHRNGHRHDGHRGLLKKGPAREAIKVIHAALDQGIRLIDPAHSYVWLGSGLENRR